MIRIICDRCGKELANYLKQPRYMNRYYEGYDFCDDCKIVYEQIQEKIEKRRKELIKQYEKEFKKEEERLLKGLKKDV